MQQKPEPTLKELDIAYFVQRYLSLFWRWKWYMIISGPIVALGFFFYIMKFGSLAPDLDAVATVVIDNAQDYGSGVNVMETGISGTEFIKSRNFLTDIAKDLSLRMIVYKRQRSQLFDTVSVDSSALPGQYSFELSDEKKDYELYFSSFSYGIKKQLVENGELYKLGNFSRNGLHLKYSDAFLKNPYSFKFSVFPMRNTVDVLLRSISIQFRTIVKNGPVYVSISCKGKDYSLITKTANLIVDRFIDLSQGTKKQKAKESIELIEKQLQTAGEQLKVAQDSVENFRRRYPNVGLGTELMNSVSSLATLESGSSNNSSWAEEAQRIRSRMALANENDISFYVKEAIVFLISHGVAGGAVLQQEFSQLAARQQELSTGYDKSHPYVLEVKNKIAELRTKVDALLSEYAVTASSESVRQSNQVQNLTGQMRGLPLLQAKLAELERLAQVTSKIHSEILTRYNQAKIADAAETGGASIMDYAIEPVPPPDFMNLLIKLGIGVALLVAFSFGPPIGLDLIDKTARNEIELKKLMDFTVLESIPEIIKKDAVNSKKDKKKNRNGKNAAPKVRTIDKKLITADYTPDFSNELFRSLRAKIMLHMHDIEKKTIIISSHGMSEGKSLICSNLAITMAQQQLRTILIDGDIRRGVIHNSFVLNKKPGLSNFLFAEGHVDGNSMRELIQSTHIPNLSVISSGVNVPNPSELLSLPRFKELLELLKQNFDVIILDTPPICVAADAAIAGNLFSACLLVVRAGKTNVIDFRKKLQEYPNLRKKVIGVVLNGALLDRKMKEYRYSMYHY